MNEVQGATVPHCHKRDPRIRSTSRNRSLDFLLQIFAYHRMLIKRGRLRCRHWRQRGPFPLHMVHQGRDSQCIGFLLGNRVSIRECRPRSFSCLDPGYGSLRFMFHVQQRRCPQWVCLPAVPPNWYRTRRSEGKCETCSKAGSRSIGIRVPHGHHGVAHFRHLGSLRIDRPHRRIPWHP